MSLEVEALPAGTQTNISPSKPEAVNRLERHRLIAQLGRTFARRYDIQVLPSREKGVWACSLDPKVIPEIDKYIQGQRPSLDDLPANSFVPKQILYDEQAAQTMDLDQISTILHHEAGHAKYTDFRLMFEGERQAKDEGNLPTSFWLVFEGLEDPRVNSLEGEESPAIDRQIRTNQAKDLNDRITEFPLTQRPMLLQFAYNSFHCWLHGEPIPELKDTDVGRLTEKARPLLDQYFQNTDVDQRKVLQKQIWGIAKELEKKDIEREEMQQMAQRGKQRSQQGQQGGSGAGQPSMGQPGETEEQQSPSGSSQGKSQSGIPGKETDGQGQRQESQQSGTGQDTGKQSFLDRLRKSLQGKQTSQTSGSTEQNKQASPKPSAEPKQQKVDLSQLSEQELKEIKDAIEQLTPEEKAELLKKAKEVVDESQKEVLEKELPKILKMKKNEKTGEYEICPQQFNEKMQKQAEADYQEAVKQVEEEEQAEWERQELERKIQEDLRKQIEAERRQKIEMEREGFDESERDKFLLYQSLEDGIYTQVRNFKTAIAKDIPRKKEPVWEGGYFSGPKFERRDLVRKAPLGNEQFHMRQIEKPIGEPRLFIGLLVDNSGSMKGKKMEEARKTTIFFAKVCKDMNIPFMIGAFGDDSEIIKQFKQDFDNPAERIKPKIIDATTASGGSTDMHAGLKDVIEAMNEQRRRLRDSHGLIFVISDGGANAGLTGEALRDYVEENRGRLTFKAFGLSSNEIERSLIQNYLNLYFGEGNCVYPQGFEDLPDDAFRTLRVNLKQFQKYLS